MREGVRARVRVRVRGGDGGGGDGGGGDGDGGDSDGDSVGVPTTLQSGQTPGPSRPGTNHSVWVIPQFDKTRP